MSLFVEKPMNANKYLIAAVVAEAAVIIGLWFGPSAQPARADVPFAQDQAQMIQEQSTTNDKLDKIIGILQGGEIQVHVAKADDSSGK
jgi:hypothetical protein